MKRILRRKISIILVSVFFCLVSTINITALNNAEADEENEMYFPVMTDIPPKSERQLELMDPDPEPPMSFAELPSQFSWLNYGGNWMTPVKDQASCGSCWAFSAMGAFEGAINLAKGDPDFDVQLSEQYILSCLPEAGSCGGGWMSEAIEYAMSSSPGTAGNGINGVPKQECMPYQAVDYIPCSSKCPDWDYFTSPPKEDNMLWQVKSFGVTSISEDDPNGWNLMKTWILEHGPISIDIYTGGWSGYWNSHHSPTDVYQNDDPGTTNHGVVLCGWVDDASIMNGGYWIIKNSWGTGWGYGGYGNIAYGCNSVGTRDITYVDAMDWPGGSGGGGTIDVDMAVFSNFEYQTQDNSEYPHLGDEIEFNDISDGDVVLREWDFNSDGTIDSTKKNPTWTYMQEGEYEVTLTVYSGWGLSNNRTRVVEVREIWPPEAICTPDEFVDNELEVDFDARLSHDLDGGRIVSYHWDFGDGTTSDESHVTHVFPEGDREYEVTLTVTDNDGASSTDTCMVRIDQTIPPVTEINHGIGAPSQTWYRTTQRISFIATDWSEVISTYYRISGGEWELYTKGSYIPINGCGSHTIECYSVDYYGNEEAVKSETFSIDCDPPTVDYSISGTQENGWYNSAVSVELTGSDDLSGLNKIIYKLNSENWADYNSGLSLGEGRHKLMVVGVDVAGNTVEEAVDINVDIGSPTSNVIFSGDGSASKGLFYKSVELRFAASDSGSGVQDVFYRVDGGSFNAYQDGVAVSVETEGDHTVDFYAVDNLGNKEGQQSKTFTIMPVNFKLNMEQPSDYLYLFNIPLFSLGNPVIVGPIDIVAELDVFTGGAADIEVVEFMVDGEVLMQDTQFPYMWRLDTSLFGNHEIGVNVVTPDGVQISESVQAMCIIP